MAHIDALSRCNNILVLEGNTFEQVLSIKQNQNTEINKIRNRIGKAKLYELRDGLIYRKIKTSCYFIYRK